jgi:prepilin-type N-terminal cleavage/methylation domain-containing protein
MKKRGWTVIELVMVIVIVAIIVVVSLPKADSIHYIKLQAAAKRALSDIRYAQQLSIARHTTCRMVFSAANDTYKVECLEPDGATYDYATDPFTRADLLINFTSDPEHAGVDISGTTLSSGTVQFDWKGVPLASDGTELTSQQSVTLTYKGLTRVIYITPSTGRVRLE